MSNNNKDESRFAYKTMASIVHKQDRSQLRPDEPTGESERVTAERLKGVMGAAVKRAGSTIEEAKKKAASKKKRGGAVDEAVEKALVKSSNYLSSGAGNLLSAAPGGGSVYYEDLLASSEAATLTYTPQTRASERAYEELLTKVAALLPDVPRDVLRSAGEEVLALMKDPNRTPDEKKHDVEGILSSITDGDFRSLNETCEAINDFSPGGASSSSSSMGRGKREESGIAVIFEEEDEEDEDDEEGGVEEHVVDTDVSSEEEGEEDEKKKEETANEYQDETKVILGSTNNKRNKSSASSFVSPDTASLDVKGEDDEGRVDPRAVDAYWLQREVAAELEPGGASGEEVHTVAESCLEALADFDSSDDASCESRLLALLGFERFRLVKKLLVNRPVVAMCTLLARAGNDGEARVKVETQIAERFPALLTQLSSATNQLPSSSQQQQQQQQQQQGGGGSRKKSGSKKDKNKLTEMEMEIEEEGTRNRRLKPDLANPIDLSAMVLAQQTAALSLGGDASSTITLPKGSSHRVEKSYEVVHVRPLKPRPPPEGERLVKVETDLPPWMRPAFKGMKELNRVQSRVYASAAPAWAKSVFPNVAPPDDAFNMLVCAPTGAGKTNVAMLAIMNEVGKFVGKDGEVDGPAMRERMKVVYVAPMKALVQEVVANFTNRLTEAYGIKVRELSGDRQLSRAEIADTQLVVTTPEKWDVVTRKAGDRAFTQWVRLLIVDEIHLLHDPRGAVLEAVVARTIRAGANAGGAVRVLGISATLPNYADVAAFLRAPPDRGLFFFDNTYRPVPLQQVYVGISERKPLKRMQLQDQICYERTAASAKENQVLIFVHSRKDTVKTAKYLRSRALELDQAGVFLPSHAHSKDVIARVTAVRGETDGVGGEAKAGEEAGDADTVTSADLRDLLPFGFAVHHAGLKKSDRSLVESLFESGHIRVLVSTATLAWGVNLPAHTVIIKGTQVYYPERGRWGELSQLDVLQMLGRAGRPQFDTKEGGEGVIITTAAEMRHYLSLLNEQLPVESQLLPRLAEHINAEVACGSVESLGDAVDWLAHTFLFVRAVRNPSRYVMLPSHLEGLPEGGGATIGPHTLLQWRVDVAHAALLVLDKHQLVRYDRRAGVVSSLPLGRVASNYYLTPESVEAFSKVLDPTAGDAELLRVIASAGDFRQVLPRAEEKREIARLLEAVPVPIREGADTSAAKVNALLQAYISRHPLEGFALACDLVYVHQSAGRVARALYEMCLQREWAQAARRALEMALMVDRRLWRSQSPLRQLSGAGAASLPEEVLERLERKGVPWSRFADFTPVELGAMAREPRLGNTLHRLVRCFPRLELSANVRPLSATGARVDLTLISDFEFDPNVLGADRLLFWILVQEGESGEKLIHHEPFVLKARFNEEEHVISFVLPALPSPLPPFLHCRVECDRFLHARFSVAIPLHRLVFPPPPSPFTELLDMAPLARSSLKTEEEREHVFPPARLPSGTFPPLLTQVYHALRETDLNVLVCASGDRSACAEFAICRALEVDPDARVVYLTSAPDETRERLVRDWEARFPERRVVHIARGTEVGEAARMMAEATVGVCHYGTWENLTRRWRHKSRRVLMEASLLVAEDLHLLGAEEEGPLAEIAVSRMRFAAAQLGRVMRVVGLSQPVANAEDVAGWIEARKTCFAFSPAAARARPLEISLRSFDEINSEARLGLMVKPAFQTAKRFGFSTPSPGELEEVEEDESMEVEGKEKGKKNKKQKRNDDDKKGVIVFVPNKRQAMMTLVDFSLYLGKKRDEMSSEEEGGRGATTEQQQQRRRERLTAENGPHPLKDELVRRSFVRDRAVAVHEGMAEEDREASQALFTSGEARVMVATASYVRRLRWEVRGEAVVVMDTSRFEGRRRRYEEYAPWEVAEMVERAGAYCQFLIHDARKALYKRIASAPPAVESSLDARLVDFILCEVAAKTIENKQDALDWLTWTLYFRRCLKNPGYYGFASAALVENAANLKAEISRALSEVVDRCVEELVEAKCVAVVGTSAADRNGEDEQQQQQQGEGETLRALNLGMIAAHYDVRCSTMELFSASLQSKTKLRGALEIIASATEFLGVGAPRAREETSLARLARHAPSLSAAPNAPAAPPTSLDFSAAHTKVAVLLQAYFARMSLGKGLAAREQGEDLAAILELVPRLAHALLDVSASAGWLRPALVAVELCQMTVQGVRSKESPLHQLPLPWNGPESASQAFERAGVRTVYDLIRMEDDAREALLGRFPVEAVAKTAALCNAYPAVEVSASLNGREVRVSRGEAEALMAGETGNELVVILTREGEEEEGEAEGQVVSARFPHPKTEAWWVVLGDAASNTLLAVKRAPLRGEVRLGFSLEALGGGEREQKQRRQLSLFVVCDSYVGCDHQINFEVVWTG